MSLDYRAGVAAILSTDGRSITAPIAVPDDAGLVKGSTFFPSDSRMEFRAADRAFTLHIGNIGQIAVSPVVYLDQNHWIDFARWRKDATAVSAEKRLFFDALDSAASASRVIVPLSAAHLVETTKRGGRSRLELAGTMLQISRGWQMRSVLALRRAELRALFSPPAALTREDVITLDPYVMFDDVPEEWIGADFGPEIASLLRRQIWATILVSLLIDDKPDEASGGEVVSRWSQSFTPLAQHMRNNARAKTFSRDLTRTRFITDLGNDLPAAVKEAGMSPDDFGRWLKDKAETALAASPGLGRLREVLHLRISNADDKWEANDLNDWFHLSYAAAYCDLVVGEKKAINYLRRSAPRVTPGATLHFRASEALPDLERLTTDTNAADAAT